MQTAVMTKHNVERIASRIVANELEFRDFRVTDLNKDGLSANVDLLAASGGRCLQIQVKGASQTKKPNGWEDWWVGYGYADAKVVAGSKQMFNRITGSFLRSKYRRTGGSKNPQRVPRRHSTCSRCRSGSPNQSQPCF